MLAVTNCFAQTQTLISEAWAEDKGSQNFFQKNVTVTDVNQNVYIAGATLNFNGDYDLLLTKYDYKGIELWTQQVAGNGNGNDFATAIFIDAALNVYVTGTVYEGSANKNDIVVLKYNSSGTLQWDAYYNGTSSDNDVGGDIIVDGSGNVFITGSSYDTLTQYDFVTMKLDSSGSSQWVQTWDDAGFNDAANKITLNSKVYVAGGTQISSVKWQYGMVVYDASSGSQIGYTVTGGSNSTGIDKVTGIARDGNGNIYVTGGAVNPAAGYDCYTLKLDSGLNVEWTATYNGNDNLDDVANSVGVDSQGNVYVCGYTTKANEGKDYILIKYDASGSAEWKQTYNHAINGDDEATALALKSDAEIIVTGRSSNGSNEDYYTIKYTEDGDEVWSIAYDGGLNDKPTAIAVDNQGGIIVAGQSEIPGAIKYMTVKYEEVEGIIPPDDVPCPASFAFYPNRGQIIDTQDSLRPDIKFYADNVYPTLYFSKPIEEENYRMVSYAFSQYEDTTNTDTLQRVDLTFERDWKIAEAANLKTQPLPSEKNGQGYRNYFLGHCPKGVTGVEGFSRLYYPEVFEGTDVLFYGNNAGMKLYIIVKP